MWRQMLTSVWILLLVLDKLEFQESFVVLAHAPGKVFKALFDVFF